MTVRKIKVKGEKLSFLAHADSAEQLIAGTATGETPTGWNLKVKGTYLYWVDNDGAERRKEGTLTGGSRTFGSIKVKGETLLFGDEDGNERSLSAVAIRYAYVAARDDNSLTVLDCSDPTNITYLGNLSGTGSPNYLQTVNDVVIAYPYAYTCSNDGNDGFSIFDISDPTAITRVGGIIPGDAQDPTYLLNDCHSLIKSEDYVYIACRANGLFVVDVSTPATPTKAGTYETYGLYHMAKSGNTLYCTGSDALIILDITNLGSIALYSRTTGTGSPNYLNNARGLAINGTDLYVVAEVDDAIVCWNVTDPTNPTTRSSLAGAGSPNYLNTAQVVLVSGNFAYVGVNGEHGVTVIDITDPDAISYHGGVYDSSPWTYCYEIYDLKKSGNYLFIANYYSGVSSVDISDPSSPSFTGNIKGAGSPNYLDYCHGLDLQD